MRISVRHAAIFWTLGLVLATVALAIRHFEKDARGQVSLAAGDAVEIGAETLVLRKFEIERYPSGKPRQFVSEVSVIVPGEDALPSAVNSKISVNHPLVRGDLWIYQSAYNEALGETVLVVVRDRCLALAVMAGVLLLLGSLVNVFADRSECICIETSAEAHSPIRRKISIGAALLTLAIPTFIILRAVLRPEPVPALQLPLMAPHVAAYATSYAIMIFAAFGIGRRLMPIGFLLMTVGLVLGAIWGKICWGDWWQYDPKEMWGLFTFLTYAGYFLVRRYPRLELVLRIAGATIVLLTATWVNFSVHFSGLHSYAS